MMLCGRQAEPRTRLRIALPLVLLCGTVFVGPAHGAEFDFAAIPPVVAKIDELVEKHWRALGVQPAAAADDAVFLRRITLDLAGRIPTPRELDNYLGDKSPEKRDALIRALIGGPEFALHFGSVLDEMIQGDYAGNEAFVDYLRRGLWQGTAWDQTFREIMLGPWNDDELKPANRFLDKRAKRLEVLATDAARVFFGVDITCAKCHDHPLVDDWTQAHFYGMAAFFNRTTGGKGKVGEKSEGEVTFLVGGREKTAKMMFLSGRVIDEPQSGADKSAKDKQSQFSRRQQLVAAALEEKQFFSRAIVNRMWQYFLGRGLVEPVDQMHSQNPPSVPGLLEWLAADLAGSGYDLRRLAAAIVSSRVYGLSSGWSHEEPLPDADAFAVAPLRPLSRRQLALALVLATGEETLDKPAPIQDRAGRLFGVDGLSRVENYLAIEARAEPLKKSFDPRSINFQSSVREALYVSNSPAFQTLVQSAGNNLAARLSAEGSHRKIVELAVHTIFSRPVREDEMQTLVAWLDARTQDRTKACEHLVWALVTSAEFRFNQ